MAECVMDFPHLAIWCPSCWSEVMETRKVKALEEANALKRQELMQSRTTEEVQTLPRPQRFVAPPATRKEIKPQGGMNIEPLRHDGQ